MLKVDDGLINTYLQEFSVPCQPEILNSIHQELDRSKPNFARISDLIMKDVSLSAAVLQIANSQVFQRKKHHDQPYQNIPEAIEHIGIFRLNKLIKALELRDKVLKVPNVHFDRFWDSACDAAIVAGYLAGIFKIDTAQAYMLGLFHNAGIAILLQAIPNYHDALVRAEEQPTQSLSSIENEMFGINHRIVGYALSRYWHLPEVIQRGILNFNRIKVFDENVDPNDLDYRANLLVCTVKLADKIASIFRSLEHTHQEVTLHYHAEELDPLIAKVLVIEPDILVDIMEETLENMENLLQQHDR